jgi:hypothetical protein
MIHGRGIGESFGLACGEFLIHNKPVITYALSPQRNHIDVLGKMLFYIRGLESYQKYFYILISLDIKNKIGIAAPLIFPRQSL